jgi:hypothetical protein
MKLKKNILLGNYRANINQNFQLGGHLGWKSGSTDHFWKGAIQESFQQNLVDIGSVVSEEKIFFKFHPPFFLICIIGQHRQKFKVHKKSCI